MKGCSGQGANLGMPRCRRLAACWCGSSATCLGCLLTSQELRLAARWGPGVFLVFSVRRSLVPFRSAQTPLLCCQCCLVCPVERGCPMSWILRSFLAPTRDRPLYLGIGRRSAAGFLGGLCLPVCSPGACAGRRGWLFNCLGTTFRRWGPWVPPVFPPALTRSVFFVRLLLVLRIAQWEEMKKTSVSTDPSAFKTLS